MGASNSRERPLLQKYSEGGENARFKYAVSSVQDRRKNKKDAFAAIPDLDDLTSFFGVYDGQEGTEVALLCATQFHTELFNHPDYQRDLANAMRMAFFRMDELLEQSDEWKELLSRDTCGGRIQCLCLRTCISAYHWPCAQPPPPYIPPQESGSTACVAAIRGHKIIIGNVGHSRCIISRNGEAIELTNEHKPSHPTEKYRIERAGGRVTIDSALVPGEAEWFFRQRESGISRINGILAHSRAIGHFAFKYNKDFPPEEQMVTCDPDVLTMDITSDIEFLVIVSDGIWTCLTCQGVVDYIHHYLRPRRTDLRTICQKLCDRCEVSSDNVTVILLQFKNAPPPPAPEEDNAANNGDNAGPPADAGNNRDNAAPPAPEETPLLRDDAITEA
ncbi:probable protein phosphatase 2C 21 [Panicum virgatum]|uniref:protein-serine/threonine phosphatase n=1 Tax=Panicum virgatum TaxID=38727 RepID=A0A8T0WTB2_PANVG|nr:probable protein phosphatase 2C 21 [Panicum virgatum]KAG2652791.1 hypothetical protein PVAP13_1NG379800 [Panicum virgatum]